MALRVFAIVSLFLFSVNTYAQEDSVRRIVSKFEKFRDQSFSEKLFLHIDKTFYLTGDYLWFKVYGVNGTSHQPSSMSKVAYIEIVDNKNRPVIQAKAKLDQATGNSAIFLPASLNSGNYTLRTYTRWMQNFSPELFFHKTITIVNPFKPLQQEVNSPNRKYDFQVFPEGGEMITGIETKVAYRIVDTDGKGVACKGWVIDQDYDTVAQFAPLKFGLGNFKFTALTGKQYKVIVKDAEGNIIAMKEMAPARIEGYSMALLPEDEKLLVIVRSRFDEEALRVVSLVVHSRGELVTTGIKGLHLGAGTFTIDKGLMPDGISHITLFDQNNQPVCERLYFKPPVVRLNLTGNTDKQEYSLRQKVAVSINAKNNNAVGVPSDLSVSVYRLDSLQLEDQHNIQNYFLLTSELKGTIESPSYYFSNDPDVNEAVDNLMLTHGWRRFQWKEVLSSKLPERALVPEYRGHLVFGSLVDLDSGKAATNIPAYLSIPGKNFVLRTTKSNRKGEIKFELKDFYGPNKMIVQTNTRVDSLYKLSINNPFSEKFVDTQLPLLDISEKNADQLITRSMGMQFENAYNDEQRGRITTIMRDTIPFYGQPDEDYILDDYTRFPVMEEVMREYVPGILVRKRKKDFYFITLDDNNKSVFRENPLVLLDGIPVFDVNKIMEYDPLKVKSLDVITKKYFYGSLSFPGVASYRTYEGNYPEFTIDERALVLDYEGMLWDREFFSPVYETQAQQSSRIPDFRNMLYWSPSIVTDRQGNGKFEFYTSDQPGLYLVNVQGLTKDGLFGSSTFTFRVTVPPNN